MRLTALFLLVLASSMAVQAQGAAEKTAVTDRRPAIINDIVSTGRAAAAKNVTRPFADQISRNNRQFVAAYLMAAHAERPGYTALLKVLEAGRVDKQVGSPPSSSGGTTLAMKGLAPRIFGFAVERGALTREIAGTSVTFRANPVGLFKALQGS